MKVVIAAGGTAGHVNPALALARALHPHEVSFIGTRTGLEASAVPARGFELDHVDVIGFDRSRPGRFPVVAGRAAKAVSSARRVLARRSPAVVVGMGGYVSLPVCVAARTRSIPFVIHEQNIVLGLANKVARPLAARVGVSFGETLPAAGKKGVLVGNPVLPEIAELDRDAARRSGYRRFGLDPGRKTVIVFGGSLGAKTLNEAAPGLAAGWAGRDDVQVLHISGRSRETQAAAADDAPGYRRIEYTDAMAEAYAVADVAVCRGGATTVAELTAVGVAAVIVPYPHHRDRQQVRHGEVLQNAGAAVVVDDGSATAEVLGGVVEGLIDAGKLAGMAASARSLGRPEAAASLAEVVLEVA